MLSMMERESDKRTVWKRRQKLDRIAHHATVFYFRNNEMSLDVPNMAVPGPAQRMSQSNLKIK